MRERKNKKREEPSAPLWMNTYGDMVTLVLVFFVMLFSFSTVDASKWRALVSVLSGSSGILDLNPGSIGINSGDTIDEDESKGADHTPGETVMPGDEAQGFNKLYGKIKEYVESEGFNAEIEIINGDSQIIIRFKDNVLFDSGKADLKPGAIPILINISEMLTLYLDDVSMIMIEGHTDNVPIHTSRYPDNWELSVARALTVLRFFIEKRSMDPEKLSAIGYGEYHPVAPNDTAENRALNRRVDIVLSRIAPGQQNQLSP